METFRQTVVDYVKGVDADFEPQAAAPAPEEAYPRRDIVGVHPQKQEGKSWVCVTTPAGRLMSEDVSELMNGRPGLPGGGLWLVGWLMLVCFCDPFFFFFVVLERAEES